MGPKLHVIFKWTIHDHDTKLWSNFHDLAGLGLQHWKITRPLRWIFNQCQLEIFITSLPTVTDTQKSTVSPSFFQKEILT